MQKIEITIKLTSGESLGLATAASDLIKWESHFDLGIDKLQKLTHLYYLAWLASKRLGKTSSEFEVWAETVDAVEVSDPKG
jgi:hypothetical protein